MAHAGPSLLLGLLTIALFVAIHAARARERLSRGAFQWLLGLCVALAFVFHLGLLKTSDQGLRVSLRPPAPHVHEFFHYYLAPKYFAELGHLGLYEASVIADFEDTPERFRHGNTFRNLATNVLDRRRGDVIAEGSAARRSFSPERWEAFKDDVALLRDAVPPALWDRSSYQADHGYNGSPLTTLILGSLANQPWLSSYQFLSLIRWLDLALITGLACVLSAAIGWTRALQFLALFWLNPLNEYGYIGGSYLRYNYVIALALAFTLYSERRPIGAGVSFAIAAGLRLFPGLFVAALGLGSLAAPDRVARVRSHLSLYLSAAAAFVLLILATAWIDTPGGANAWKAFSGRIGTHAGGYAYNAFGLSQPFGYQHDHRYGELVRRLEQHGENVDWESAMGAAQERRRPYRLALTALLALALVAAARRIATRDLLFLGFPLIFLAIDLSSYYYASLGLIPLLLPHRRDVTALLVGLFALGMLSCLAFPFWYGPDILFQLLGLEIALFLALCVWRLARHPSPEAPFRPDGAVPQ